MDILYLNSGKQDVPTKLNYLIDAAKHIGVDCVMEVPKDKNIELKYVLNIQPYVDNVRKGTVWTGCWEIDCIINKHRLEKHWDEMDTIFMANTFRRVNWTKKHIMLYQACDSSFYNELSDKKIHDFILCGSTSDVYYYKDYGLAGPDVRADIYTERMRRINMLRKEFSCDIISERMPIKDYIKSLSVARVQFIQSMKVVDDEEVAQRFFECLPIGPILTNFAIDFREIGLVEGEDYLSYSTDHEMMEKMELLIKNENYRNRIAENGRKKAFMYHTYEHRLMSILIFLRNNYGFR